jgi:very-short-patch-repair endonuclease
MVESQTMPKRLSQHPPNATRARARELRRNATGPERMLWSALHARQVGGLKFRRQHPIEPYIVDFYCAQAKLVIELDGESHEGRQGYDLQRERFLRRQGFKVFRVTNDDVLDNLEGVCEAIVRAAGQGEHECEGGANRHRGPLP